jgi:hypothetical protein
MNCRDIEPLIYLVREGELTEKERDIVSEHIQGCARCRELALSVQAMTFAVSKADYNLNIKGVDESFYYRLMQKINKPAGSYKFIIVKATAACLLIILISTFIIQERNFYQSQMDLQARIQQADPGFSDCLRELKRKIHYQSITAFSRPDSLPVNLVSEEALTSYVRENCGYNTKDIKVIKKMLIQAGLID